jgi:hypothetical protein
MHNVETSSPSARLVPRAVHGLLVVALAVACTTAPGASPSVAPQTGSPLPAGSPLPTASPPPPTVSPTATPIPSPTFGADQISHPTGPTDVVLQMELGGGFVPIEFNLTQAPSFSLYGDGTLIFRPTADAGPLGPNLGLPNFLQAQLTEEQVQALLRFALGQGRLLDAREHYPQNTCADCPSTTFTLNAADMSRTVVVDGLSEVEPAGPDAVERRAFAQLAQTLNGFEQDARNGELGEVTAHDPQLYRVVLMEASGGVGGAPKAWPWPDLTVDDFAVEGDGFRRVAVMTRELVAMVVEVPTGGIGSIVVEAPDDELWSIAVRPLLPNEIPADPPLVQ